MVFDRSDMGPPISRVKERQLAICFRPFVGLFIAPLKTAWGPPCWMCFCFGDVLVDWLHHGMRFSSSRPTIFD